MNFNVTKDFNQKFSKYVSIFFQDSVDICESVTDNNKEFIKQIIAQDNFTGKNGEVLSLNLFQNNELINMVLIGAGPKDTFSSNEYRLTLYKALKSIKGDIFISSKEEILADPYLLSEVVSHINYRFDKYSEKKEDSLLEATLFTDKNIDLTEISHLNNATLLTKDLINEQAEVMTPKKLAEITIAKGREFGFEVEILEEQQIKELGMEAYLAVARASVNRPHLIVMRYFGDPNSDYIHGLVGKGLTYDSGGLSLKPTDSMVDMKDDMGGGAIVIGSMCAIAANKLKKNVIAVVAACENSIGSKAYRPGDIIGSMSGKYIEVLNTDAEGRLTLADAMTYISKVEKASEIIDVATLTGAVMIALGNAATGVFTNQEEMFKKIMKASSQWEENYWLLPIYPEYRKLIKSDIASIKNSTGRLASASTAAAFLEVFCESLPWVHLDVAGTASIDKDGEYYKKGGTGIGVKMLYSYIKD